MGEIIDPLGWMKKGDQMPEDPIRTALKRKKETDRHDSGVKQNDKSNSNPSEGGHQEHDLLRRAAEGPSGGKPELPQIPVSSRERADTRSLEVKTDDHVNIETVVRRGVDETLYGNNIDQIEGQIVAALKSSRKPIKSMFSVPARHSERKSYRSSYGDGGLEDVGLLTTDGLKSRDYVVEKIGNNTSDSDLTVSETVRLYQEEIREKEAKGLRLKATVPVIESHQHMSGAGGTDGHEGTIAIYENREKGSNDEVIVVENVGGDMDINYNNLVNKPLAKGDVVKAGLGLFRTVGYSMMGMREYSMSTSSPTEIARQVADKLEELQASGREVVAIHPISHKNNTRSYSGQSTETAQDGGIKDILIYSRKSESTVPKYEVFLLDENNHSSLYETTDYLTPLEAKIKKLEEDGYVIEQVVPLAEHHKLNAGLLGYSGYGKDGIKNIIIICRKKSK